MFGLFWCKSQHESVGKRRNLARNNHEWGATEGALFRPSRVVDATNRFLWRKVLHGRGRSSRFHFHVGTFVAQLDQLFRLPFTETLDFRQ